MSWSDQEIRAMMLKLPTVIRETALSRSSIYAAISEGKFPAPRRIGARSVAWRLEDIEDWKNSRPPSIKIKAAGL
jgi:prophage regulatory protein